MNPIAQVPGLPFATSLEPKSVDVPNNTRLWVGRVCALLVIAFLGFDCVGKLLRLAPVLEGSAKVGFGAHLVLPLGLIELACLVPFAIPRFRALGAVLLSGYLGGAVATHLHLGDPLLSHTLFPLYFGALVWAAAFATEPRTAQLLFGRSAR
jgi:hypothetical protein